MISYLAWPRAFLLFVLVQTALFSSFVEAKIDSLFTSSVTYCSPPEAILIQEFSVIYFASNQSVFFNISAASVVPNLRVRANILLNVYGMQPVNVTEDFCSVFGDTLCPLPTYNFTGSASLMLPASIDVASKVPGIAYKIPDLEAFAQLTLTDTKTGDVAACIQATLSNGWSSRQRAVAFTSGGVAIFALFSALLHSLLPSTPFAFVSPHMLPSIAPARFVDFVLLIQQICFTGLIHLNLPLSYRAFTSNFAWALGLFPESQTIQQAIDHMRHLTGGNMQDGVQSPIAYVNRQLSPYNVPVPAGTSPTSFFLRLANTALVAANQTAMTRAATTDSSSGDGPPATVTDSGADILPAGIPVYVNSLDIGTANALMSVFFTALIGVVVGAGVLGIMYIFLTIGTTRLKDNKWAWTDVMHAELHWFAVSNGIRYAMVILSPVLIFTFFQWTLDDSWLSILLSVILLLCTAAALFYPTVCIMLIARRMNSQTLYTTPSYLRTFGALYIPFRHDSFYFFLPFFAAAFLKSIFISFVRMSGITQVIVLLVIELALLVLLCVKKPHRNRGGDVLAIYLAVTRVAVAVLMFPFIESFHIQAIPRVAVGFVIIVIFSIAVIVMVINIIINFGTGLLWRRHGSAPLGSSSGSVGDMEKGSLGKFPTPPSTTVLRPTNPTPSTSFSQDVSAHSRHSPNMNAAVSPNFTIPSFYSSERDDGEETPQPRSQRSSLFTASSPSQHLTFPSLQEHKTASQPPSPPYGHERTD